MKEGPSASASRRRRQTTPGCCGQKPLVVSAGGKSDGEYPAPVGVRETNESEPSMTRRNPENCRQNQERFYLLGSVRRIPGYRAGGGRRIGGVNLTRALMRNCGNQGTDAKGEAQVDSNHEARVPMQCPGTDRPVRAGKAGNSAGAKGSAQAAVLLAQLETGGGQ
jgi:hypothetical protein